MDKIVLITHGVLFLVSPALTAVKADALSASGSFATFSS